MSTKWKKGQSGNPGGRPKQLAAVQALARQHTVAAIKRLADIAQGQHGAKPSEQTRAAEILLNRGWGAPTQPVDLNGSAGVTIRIVRFREGADGEVESSEHDDDGQ